MVLLQEEKEKEKNKKFDMHPLGIEPGPTDSESNMLTTLPSMHMALTRDQAQMHANEACIFKRDTDKNKEKTQRQKP